MRIPALLLLAGLTTACAGGNPSTSADRAPAPIQQPDVHVERQAADLPGDCQRVSTLDAPADAGSTGFYCPGPEAGGSKTSKVAFP